MPSSISTARQNLHDLLTDHDWPVNGAGEKPQVAFGYPLGYEEQEVVALGGVDDATEEEAALGMGHHEESYTLLLEIKVYDPAGDAEEVDQRGWELAEEVREVVHTTTQADRNLKGAVRHCQVASQVSAGAVPAQIAAETLSGGWVIFITVRIACFVRIS